MPSRPESAARRVASLGVLFALSIALSVAEGAIPVPVSVPGVKIGLSNIAVMYCLLCLSPWEALALAAVKGGFAFVTRGFTAGLLSFSGGLASVLLMLLILRLTRGRASVLVLSITGAVTHNIAQLAAAAALAKNILLLYDLPVLLFFGVIMGAANCALLRLLLPALRRVGRD